MGVTLEKNWKEKLLTQGAGALKGNAFTVFTQEKEWSIPVWVEQRVAGAATCGEYPNYQLLKNCNYGV